MTTTPVPKENGLDYDSKEGTEGLRVTGGPQTPVESGGPPQSYGVGEDAGHVCPVPDGEGAPGLPPDGVVEVTDLRPVTSTGPGRRGQGVTGQPRLTTCRSGGPTGPGRRGSPVRLGLTTTPTGLDETLGDTRSANGLCTCLSRSGPLSTARRRRLTTVVGSTGGVTAPVPSDDPGRTVLEATAVGTRETGTGVGTVLLTRPLVSELPRVASVVSILDPRLCSVACFTRPVYTGLTPSPES